MRRSPAPKPEIFGSHVAAVRPRDLPASFSNSRSSSGRLHSSLGNVPPREYLTGCIWKAEGRVGARFVPVESGRTRRFDSSQTHNSSWIGGKPETEPLPNFSFGDNKKFTALYLPRDGGAYGFFRIVGYT